MSVKKIKVSGHQFTDICLFPRLSTSAQWMRRSLRMGFNWIKILTQIMMMI